MKQSAISKGIFCLRTFLTILFSVLVVCPALSGQESEVSLDAGETGGAPPEARQAATENIASAYDQAMKERDALKETIARQAQEQGDEIAALQAEVVSLAEDEASKRKTLDALMKKAAELQEALYTAESKQAEMQTKLDSVENELGSQAHSFVERFKGSLLAKEDPSLITRGQQVLGGDTSVFFDRLDLLLSLYSEVMDRSKSASRFTYPIKLAGEKGTIEASDVFRLGLLGGFYRNKEHRDSGILLSAAGTDDHIEGRSEGLTAFQHTSIDVLMDDPQAGLLMPFDVTGGAGLQTLQARDSLETWFEKGGVFMYALLTMAVLAVLLILERMVVLAYHTLGMKRHIRKVKQLVKKNQIDSATEYCEKAGGATGGVLHSALAHHNKDRAVMEDAIKESLLHHTPAFQARLSFISLCAAVAPLMGLLGTVTGMIATFKMVTIFGTSDPRYMAGGISEALITTQGGLYLAIPCLLFRGVLGAVADNAIAKLESGAMSVVLTLLNKPASTGTLPGSSKLGGRPVSSARDERKRPGYTKPFRQTETPSAGGKEQ